MAKLEAFLYRLEGAILEFKNHFLHSPMNCTSGRSEDQSRIYIIMHIYESMVVILDPTGVNFLVVGVVYFESSMLNCSIVVGISSQGTSVSLENQGKLSF